MKHHDLGAGTYLLVFDAGDEIGAELRKFAGNLNVQLASFNAIGALSSVELIAFDAEAKQYRTAVKLDEQCELASMVGNIGRHENELVVHAHLTIGKLDGTALAGHLKNAVVCPNCELFLTAYQTGIEKKLDELWKLPLFKL